MTAETARSLLIVEDDLALQKQIKWSMDRFESVVAHDRESALVQMRRNNPAVVTMDLGLPPDPDSVSEGFKLLEQLLGQQGEILPPLSERRHFNCQFRDPVIEIGYQLL